MPEEKEYLKNLEKGFVSFKKIADVITSSLGIKKNNLTEVLIQNIESLEEEENSLVAMLTIILSPNKIKLHGELNESIDHVEVKIAGGTNATLERPRLKLEFYQFEEDSKPLFTTESTGDFKAQDGSDFVFKFKPELQNEHLANVNIVRAALLNAPEAAALKSVQFFRSLSRSLEAPDNSKNLLLMHNIFNTITKDSWKRELCEKSDEEIHRLLQSVRSMLKTEHPKTAMIAGSIILELSKDQEFVKRIDKNDLLNALLEFALKGDLDEGQRLNATGMPIVSIFHQMEPEDVKVKAEDKDRLVGILTQCAANLMGNNRYADALIALEDSYRYSKDNLGTLNMIHHAVTKLGDYKKAAYYKRILIGIMPFSADSRLELAMDLFAKKGNSLDERKEAIYNLKKGISYENSSDPSKLYFLLADILCSMNLEEEAVFYLERFCKTQEGSQDPESHLRLAQKLQKLAVKRNEKKFLEYACEKLKFASEIQKYSSDTFSELAACQVQLSQLDDAFETVQKMLKTDTDHPQALSLLGRVERLRKNYNQSEESLLKLKSVENYTFRPLDYFTLASSQEKLEKPAESLKNNLSAVKILGEWALEDSSDNKKKKLKAELGVLKKMHKRCAMNKCEKSLEKAVKEAVGKWGIE